MNMFVTRYPKDPLIQSGFSPQDNLLAAKFWDVRLTAADCKTDCLHPLNKRPCEKVALIKTFSWGLQKSSVGGADCRLSFVLLSFKYCLCHPILFYVN